MRTRRYQLTSYAELSFSGKLVTTDLVDLATFLVFFKDYARSLYDTQYASLEMDMTFRSSLEVHVSITLPDGAHQSELEEAEMVMDKYHNTWLPRWKKEAFRPTTRRQK